MYKTLINDQLRQLITFKHRFKEIWPHLSNEQKLDLFETIVDSFTN
jgi:hypothetical protein